MGIATESILSNQIETLTMAKNALAHARTLDDVKAIRDKAEAIRMYVRAQGESFLIQNYAAEVKIRAERKAGFLLSESGFGQMGGDRKSKDIVSLDSLGIKNHQSKRWQKMSSVPDTEFEKHVASVIESEKELTTAGVLSLAKTAANEMRNETTIAGTSSIDDLSAIIAAGQKFACIYADPPWQYGNQATRASTDNHYPTMGTPAIAALPIAELAAENAHLHLWTTNAFIFECQEIMRAWGFTYKSMLIWVKPQMGIGNYWRVSHEIMLLGIRGRCPFLNRAQMSWVEAKRTTHSTKPDVVRQMIEKVSPGPRLELFGRRTVPGWTVWGNQVESNVFDPEAA
jgi:N6-adenosine-specific RNA methylase IME4